MLRIRVFGGLWIDRAGTPLGGVAEQPRRLALLAFLVGAGEPGVSRDKLTAQLWPDADHEHGRHALSQLIHILRRDLHPALFLTGSTNLRLNPGCIASDLWDFIHACADGQLGHALDLYRGPFLDGFYLDGSPEFERWVEVERRHLAVRVAGLVETLAKRAAERGDHRLAASFWDRLAEHDPLDSRIAASLIGELAASGNVVSALRRARGYEGLVRRELGIEPDGSVKGLVSRLLSQAAL